MNIFHQSNAQYISGKRFAIVMVSWFFASVGVLSALMFAVAGVVIDEGGGLYAITPLIAWISLAVMTIRWLQDRRCHWLWPITGSIAGVISAMLFAHAFYF